MVTWDLDYLYKTEDKDKLKAEISDLVDKFISQKEKLTQMIFYL
jgi:hypothetical protein